VKETTKFTAVSWEMIAVQLKVLQKSGRKLRSYSL